MKYVNDRTRVKLKLICLNNDVAFYFRYPMASEKELNENSDNCAICWEKMEVARKLPCRHLFHAYVLIYIYNVLLKKPCIFYYM